MLYRIGEFSALTGLSIRTLRYYDEIDLFKPEEVDLFTNYRYYKEEQLDDIRLINELKEIGFSLDEIKENWNNFNEQMFNLKKQELENDIFFKKEQIKKADELRSKIVAGKIVVKTKDSNINIDKNKIKSLY